jgi:hypothetical protein
MFVCLYFCEYCVLHTSCQIIIIHTTLLVHFPPRLTLWMACAGMRMYERAREKSLLHV